jgi:hypothetical protein
MTCSKLLTLPLIFDRGTDRLNDIFTFVPDNNRYLINSRLPDTINDMLDKRFSKQGMKHFREVRLHPNALSRSKYYCFLIDMSPALII